MRALLVFSVLLLSQITFAQAPAAPAAPATPAAPAAPEAPAAAPAAEESTEATVTVPSAFKTGIVVQPAFTYFSRKVEQDVSTTTPGNTTGSLSGDAKGLEGSVKGGYVFNFGLFAGLNLIYNTGKDTVNGIDSMKTYALAPSVAYHDQYTGFMVGLSYNLLGKSTVSSAGGDVDFDEVTGLQFDIAYPIQLTDSINIGPQISWRRLELKDASVAGVADTKTKEFLPSISAWFYF